MEMIRTTADLTFQDFLRYPALRVEEGEFAFVTGRSGADTGRNHSGSLNSGQW